MTDKEQIMIDGVDVRNCKGIDLSLPPLVKCKYLKFKTSDGGIAGIWCSDHTNCCFKQLARKTQECEVLQEQNQKLQMQLCNECGERDDYNIPCKMIRDLDYWLQKEIEENDRYRKALEEIKKVCIEDTREFADGTQIRYDTLDDILNIIDKVKKE